MAYVEAEEKLGGLGGSEAPVFGASKLSSKESSTGTTKTKPIVRVRYMVANMSDDSDRGMVEHIMSTSMRCKDSLGKVGDIAVVRESENFDREGNYNLLIKYLELVDPDSKYSGLSTPPVDEKADTSAETPMTIEDFKVQFLQSNGAEGLPRHDF